MRQMVFLSLVLGATTAFAEEVLREIPWQRALASGELVEHQEGLAEVEVSGDELVIRKVSSEPATVKLLALRDLGITGTRYAIKGRVRYEDVAGEGCLEMWSCFGGNERYFSKTLLDSGPMQKLEGSSDWRPFVLPFYIRNEHATPERLEMNVLLPGHGTVWLGPLRLVEFGAMEDPMAAPGQWWGERMGGLIGGVLGTLLGCMGGMIGLLTSRGQARSVTFAMLRAMQIIGVVGLVAGVVAVIMSQPYAVWYPMILVGIICPVLGTGLTRTIRKRYDEVELRKMAAMDAV